MAIATQIPQKTAPSEAIRKNRFGAIGMDTRSIAYLPKKWPGVKPEGTVSVFVYAVISHGMDRRGWRLSERQDSPLGKRLPRHGVPKGGGGFGEGAAGRSRDSRRFMYFHLDKKKFIIY